VQLGPLTLLFAIELLLTISGGVWMYLGGFSFVASPNPWRDAILAIVAYQVLLLLDKLVEKLLTREYQELDRLMASLVTALRRAGVSYNQTIALALASAIGEEVFFRGALLSQLKVWFGPQMALVFQAALFAAGHPAPGRAGRAYAAWTFVAGLIFGLLYLYSGSLVPGILAHFLYNARSFEELYGK